MSPPLDTPVSHALTARLAPLANGNADVRRIDPNYGLFAAFAPTGRPSDDRRPAGIAADNTGILSLGEADAAEMLGFREISAVCTHPDDRGGGKAAGLIATVAARIRGDGDVPLLISYATKTARSHATAGSASPRARRSPFTGSRAPDGPLRTPLRWQRPVLLKA